MKHRLEISDGYDFEAIGLSCHIRDFKLAWLLNKHLGWDLVRETLTVRPTPKADPHPYTAFRFRNQDHHLQYLIIANRGKEGLLVKKLTQFDFFLLVEGYLEMFEKDDCIRTIQQIAEVQLVQLLQSSYFEKLQFQVFDT